jgi:type IV pilus assembly protein PilO
VAIGPTNQRDQILTAVAVLAFVLVGAYWYFVYDPKTADVDKLSAHVDSLDMANQQAKAQLAKGSVAAIRAEAAAYRENLDLMRTLVPAGNEVPALLEQVSTAARRAKLDIAGVEPEPLIEGEMFDTYRYKVKLNGSYHEVGEVLSNIGSLNRIIAPINLNLGINAQARGSNATRQMLTAVFEIQTYVVRTSPRPKPKKPKAPVDGAGDGPVKPPAKGGP